MHIHIQTPNVSVQARIKKGSKRYRVVNERTRIGTDLLINFSNNGGRGTIYDLVVNLFGKSDRIGYVQRNNEPRNLRSQYYLNRFRVEPPIEFCCVAIRVASGKDLSPHDYDLFNQRDDRWIFLHR